MANTIKNKKTTADLTDSRKDIGKMREEEVTLDLPDVKDIPGQEFIHPPDIKEMADTTVSSADEEGKNIPGFEDETELLDEETSVRKQEADLLARSTDSQAGHEDQAWEESKLDNTDEDGDPLNEGIEFSGKDLDVPGSEEDDDNEEAGAEDEENNSYSIGGEKKD